MMAREPVTANVLTHPPRPRLRFPHAPSQSRGRGEDVGERRARSGSPCFAALSWPDRLARSTSPIRLVTAAPRWQADAPSPRTSSPSLAHRPCCASPIRVRSVVPASGRAVTATHQTVVVTSSVVAGTNLSPRSHDNQVANQFVTPYPVLLPRKNQTTPMYKCSRQEHQSRPVAESQLRSIHTGQEPVVEKIGTYDEPSLRRIRCSSPNASDSRMCEPTTTHQPIAWCTAPAEAKPQKTVCVVPQHSFNGVGMPERGTCASAWLSKCAPAGTVMTGVPVWHAAPPALPQQDVISNDLPGNHSPQQRPTMQHKPSEAERGFEPRIADRFVNLALTPWPAGIEGSTVETDVPLPSFVKRPVFLETGLRTADSPRADVRVTCPGSLSGCGRETGPDLVDRTDDLQALPSTRMPEINPEVMELCEDTREQVNQLLRIVQELGSEVDSLRRENQQLEDAIDSSRDGPENCVPSSTQSSTSPTSSQEIEDGSPRMTAQLVDVASPEDLARRDSELDEAASVGLHPLSDTEHATDARSSPPGWGVSATSLPGIDLPSLLQDLRAQSETNTREEESRPSSKPTSAKGWRKLRRDMKAASALESLLRAVRRGKVKPDAENELDVGPLAERGHYWGVELRPVKARRNRSKNAAPKVVLSRTPSQVAVMPWGGVGVGTSFLQPTEFETK